MKVEFNPKNIEEARSLVQHFVINNLYNPIRPQDEPKLITIKGSTIAQQRQFAEQWRREFLTEFRFGVYIVPRWAETGRAYVSSSHIEHGVKFSQYDDASKNPIIYINVPYIAKFIYWAVGYFPSEVRVCSNCLAGSLQWHPEYHDIHFSLPHPQSFGLGKVKFSQLTLLI